MPHEVDVLIAKVKQQIKKWKANLKRLYLFSFQKKSKRLSNKKCDVGLKKYLKSFDQSQLDDTISQVKRSYRCLKSRFKNLKKAEVWSRGKNEWDFDGIETIGILKYLLSSLGKTHEEVIFDKTNPFEKQRTRKLRKALEKAQELRVIGPKLLSLPGLLNIDFDSKVPRRIQAFLAKFDDPGSSVGEVLRCFQRLDPSLRNLSQAKAEFVEELCTGPKPRGKQNTFNKRNFQESQEGLLQTWERSFDRETIKCPRMFWGPTH